MTDLACLAIAVAFSAATWGLLKLCERLLNTDHGEQR